MRLLAGLVAIGGVSRPLVPTHVSESPAQSSSERHPFGLISCKHASQTVGGKRLKMRASRLLLIPAVVIFMTALVVPACASSPVHYVALGDSYSSGVGAGDYTGGSCRRSSHAYSALWAAEHSPASYRSAACSGATTASVLSGQLSAVTSDTTFVTITIGGNDVGSPPCSKPA